MSKAGGDQYGQDTGHSADTGPEVTGRELVVCDGQYQSSSEILAPWQGFTWRLHNGPLVPVVGSGNNAPVAVVTVWHGTNVRAAPVHSQHIAKNKIAMNFRIFRNSKSFW